MTDLVAIVYPTEAQAETVRNKLFELQKEYLIEMGDAVIAVKSPDGKIKLNQLFNTTAAGAASGSFWGLLIGMLFLNPLLGVAAGAAGGALGGALTDVGIEDSFMKKLAETIEPGTAVLFVLCFTPALISLVTIYIMNNDTVRMLMNGRGAAPARRDGA